MRKSTSATASGLFLLFAAIVLAPAAPAQPVRERRTYSWAMALRYQLWEETRDASPELLAGISKDLISDSDGNPIVPLARALARARGVEPDGAFVFRASIQCLATPEVADLDRFDHVNLTMHMPYRVPAPGEVEFDLRVFDSDGDEAWRGEIVGGTLVDKLRRYRCRTRVPLDGFPDGTYRIEVRTRLAGEPPRATDPVTTAMFHVIRGFPARVAALTDGVGALGDSTDADQLLLLQGALAQVRRLWSGEPPMGRSRAVADLKQAEAMLANVKSGRPALDGLRGWVTVSIATTADEAALVSLRLPAEPAADPRPLVLFIPGSPAWDHGHARPTSPSTTSPTWLREVLEAGSWDAAGRYQVAVLESPGRPATGVNAISAVAAKLRDLLGLADGTVLIGERAGALAVAAAVVRDPSLSQRIALICGGALDPKSAKALGDFDVLVAPALGHLSHVNLERAATLLESAGARVRRVPSESTPWSLAIPVLLPELARFVDGQ